MAGSQQQRQQIAELRALIRGTGLRATPSRIAVLSLLHERARPMSHGEVAECMADEAWDRATLYRNLIDMSDAGLLRRSDMGDHVWRFEAVTGERHAEEHPHFICTECGTVECMPDIKLELQRRRRAPRALRKREVEVQVRGLCDSCY